MTNRFTIPIIAIFCAIYYIAILTHFSFDIFHTTILGFTFNSLLDHILKGKLDVDEQAIGYEGFVEQGRVFTYFGVFPSLVRLIFIPFIDLSKRDVTIISCFLAVATAVASQLATVVAIFREANKARDNILLVSLICLTLLAGPQISFLRPSIYQEVVLWTLALSNIFIFFAVKVVLLDQHINPALLAMMAAIAGLTLITRVSTAIGLYAAMAVILLACIARASIPSPQPSSGASGFRLRIPRSVWLPAAILASFGLEVAYINFVRFGSPLTVLDPQNQIGYKLFNNLHALSMFKEHGQFEISRIWFGLLYYFFPIWFMTDGHGKHLFSNFRYDHLDAVELPPSSFFVSDPIIIFLSAIGLAYFYRAYRNRNSQDILPIFVFLALMIPAILIMCGWTFAFRYRIEFYPMFYFLAFVGLRWVLDSDFDPKHARLVRYAVVAGVPISMAVSIILVMTYYLSPFGNSDLLSGQGWVSGYYHQLLQKAPTPLKPE